MPSSPKKKQGLKLLFLTLSLFAVLLLFFGAIYFVQQAKKPETPRNVTLTDQNIAELMIHHFKDKFPIEDLNVHIARNGTMTVEATISSQELAARMQENKGDPPMGTKLMLRLLPEKVQALFTVSIAVDPDEKKLLITPTQLKINQMDIPPSLLPPLLKSGISDAANAYIKEHHLPLGTLSIEDGSIVLLE